MKLYSYGVGTFDEVALVVRHLDSPLRPIAVVNGLKALLIEAALSIPRPPLPHAAVRFAF
jgi:hypothetical protein